MAYLSVDEFKIRLQESDLRQLSDDTGENVVTDVIESILQDASDTIDGYIAKKYAVPLITIHAAVKSCTAAVATYELHVRRSWTLTDQVKYIYEAALQWLAKVASGDIEIVGATPAADATAFFQADEQKFTDSTLSGF